MPKFCPSPFETKSYVLMKTFEHRSSARGKAKRGMKRKNVDKVEAAPSGARSGEEVGHIATAFVGPSDDHS
jgi:hypothetical protein